MFAIGTVTSQDGANYRVNVILEGYAGGSMPTVSVDVLTHGPRDALRGEFPPLPTAGTRGLVVFPRADPRSGIWAGATAGPLMDASTTRPGFENVAYSARYSGFWHLQDEDGNETLVWPDGSQLTIGVAPAASRHIVQGQPGAGQQQQQATFSQAQRVAQKPSPFPVTLALASGASIAVDAAGDVTISTNGKCSVNAGVVYITSSVVQIQALPIEMPPNPYQLWNPDNAGIVNITPGI